MRFGWRERYESRGSRTVLRGAGVRLPGLLTLQILLKLSVMHEKNGILKSYVSCSLKCRKRAIS